MRKTTFFLRILKLNKAKLLIAFYLSIQSYTTFAQPFVDIANFRYQNFPSVKYTGNENSHLRINQLTGNLNLPIPLKNKNVILLGSTYDQLGFQTSNVSKRSSYLYSLLFQIGYIKSWKDGKWKSLIMLLPKFNSDEFALAKDAYQQGGILLFTYTKKESLKYKFGIYYNSELFGNFFMPLLGFEWKPNDKTNIYGVLPANLNIEYRTGKRTYIGASYQSITATYRLHQSQLSSNVFVRNGDRFWGHNQIRLFINFYLTPSLVLFAEGGYTFWRKFEVYESKHKKLDHSIYGKTNDGILINGGIAYRIRL